MSKRQQLLLLCGCLFVVALEVPRAVRQVPVDLAGPYALPATAAARLARAREAETAGVGAAATRALGATPLPLLVPVESDGPDAVAAAPR